jgi:hypothetical protein
MSEPNEVLQGGRVRVFRVRHGAKGRRYHTEDQAHVVEDLQKLLRGELAGPITVEAVEMDRAAFDKLEDYNP